ncbi:MAG: hypothetical protein KC897_04735 [Candidatus Omnitrophica bacterium]|nr:hypothetical protein [Candidatus Omnitrophota bacterium]MCB9720007.1 hypothetical protein [Candidatus Omnitrophota bacterium]
MEPIEKFIAQPSAAYAVDPKYFKYYADLRDAPRTGDMIYGEIARVSDDSYLENKSGRLHLIQDGTRGLFVMGNRYAPDYFEGYVPSSYVREVDLLERSGVVGLVKTKNSARKDPTRIRVLGYVCHKDGTIVNTRDHSLIHPRQSVKKEPRARMVLVCGTAMNSGKTMAAAACCRVLSALGHKVYAAKITGMASLKDLFAMNDAGAEECADFTRFGHPGTYLLEKSDLLEIFDKLDLQYAGNSRDYWVVELADGIIQRETAMLLESPAVQSRIHRLVFCAADAFGAIGGLRILKEHFHLEPDMISGVCSSSPLHIRELSDFTDIPVFNSLEADVQELRGCLGL